MKKYFIQINLLIFNTNYSKIIIAFNENIYMKGY